MRDGERSAAFVREWLSHRRNGVHVTQPIGQRFHHMRRKMRRLLNEKMKPAPIDLRQPAGLFATALAVRGLSSINAISPISAPGPAVSSTKSPRKISMSPSNKTYILSFSPSRNGNRQAQAAACRFPYEKAPRDSWGRFSVAAIKRTAIPAKLQLCDRRLRHSLEQILRVFRL